MKTKVLVTVTAVVVAVATGVGIADLVSEQQKKQEQAVLQARASGLAEGCVTGFDFYVRKQYGLNDLPEQIRNEIMQLCMAALSE